MFQGSSPVNEDVPLEEAEEEEVSPVNVGVGCSAVCDRVGCGNRVGQYLVTSTQHSLLLIIPSIYRFFFCSL